MKIISAKEIEAARFCLDEALRRKVSGARVILSKTLTGSLSILDGALDRSSQSCERCIDLTLFVDGRRGRFSTNRMEESSLCSFLDQAIEATSLLAPDKDRSLPGPERKCKEAVTGTETGLYDDSYCDISSESKLQFALEYTKPGPERINGARIISVESEYSDTLDEELLLDSNGGHMMDCSTSFTLSSEVTVEGPDGEKASSHDWERSAFFKDFKPSSVVDNALHKACLSLGASKIKSGTYDIIVDKACASALVYPLFDALNGLAIYYGQSFLCDSLGKSIFNPDFTIWDRPRTMGRFGSRLYDSEGIATKDAAIIENGKVMQYFSTCYTSAKCGFKPTVGEISRPVVTPFICDCDKKSITLEDILRLTGNGVYITGFNGGNCNSSTGDFSFGINGFRIKDGKIGKPTKEALLTGNIIELFSGIFAAGSDAKTCASHEIPTLAFRQMNINAL